MHFGAEEVDDCLKGPAAEPLKNELLLEKVLDIKIIIKLQILLSGTTNNTTINNCKIIIIEIVINIIK